MGPGGFFKINIFGRIIGQINKWPESMVEINILSTEDALKMAANHRKWRVPVLGNLA